MTNRKNHETALKKSTKSLKNKKGADKCQLESKSKQNRNNKSTTLVRVTTHAGEKVRVPNRIKGAFDAIKLYENFTPQTLHIRNTENKFTNTYLRFFQYSGLLDFLKYLILNSEPNVT